VRAVYTYIGGAAASTVAGHPVLGTPLLEIFCPAVVRDFRRVRRRAFAHTGHLYRWAGLYAVLPYGAVRWSSMISPKRDC
jgi:hypothetical protein